jgi:hypothetical protein
MQASGDDWTDSLRSRIEEVRSSRVLRATSSSVLRCRRIWLTRGDAAEFRSVGQWKRYPQPVLTVPAFGTATPPFSDPGHYLKSKSLPSKYRLKTSASSSLLNSTCMITLSCARWYLNTEGAYLLVVEPYAHLCHLGRKVSLGRQRHDNRSHLALQLQRVCFFRLFLSFANASSFLTAHA